MSRDDIIFIVKVGNKFFGFNIMLSAIPEVGASLDYIINKGWFKFEADSVEEAILKAQKESTEYGYEFVNLQSSEQTKEAEP
uniref:Uncharacterized protein n=1 Tax=viral metagenome TaxID=1070528 RepID=A0A6M3M6E9_9ZZZZ